MTWPSGGAGVGTALAAAYLLDWMVGDPPRPTHPVVVMGRAVAALEARLYGPAARRGWLLQAGGVLVVTVVGGTLTVAAATLAFLGQISPYLRWGLSVWWLECALATRGLTDAARGVERRLAAGDLPAARRELRALVGRDTDDLPAEEVHRAVLESVAENTTDGVVAPLFWAAVGGVPLALAYKAVNTLDSMVGYRTDRYVLFGRPAARLDDWANWLPARLGGLVILAAAALAGLDAGAAWRAWRADAARHPSPNAGIPEAVYAGALGVRLGGPDRHGGRPRWLPPLNAAGRPATAAAVSRALLLLALTSALAATLAVARWLV